MERFGRQTKEFMFNELKALFKKNPNIFVTNFSNLKAPDLRELRASLKNTSSRYVVVKNSMIQHVLKELKMENILNIINGMCGVVFVGEDPIGASKVLVNFKKEHETLDIKGGFLDGSAVSIERIKELSALPPREILLGIVVSGMYAPVTGFVNSLAGLIRKLVYVINAIKERGGKQDGGGKEGS